VHGTAGRTFSTVSLLYTAVYVCSNHSCCLMNSLVSLLWRVGGRGHVKGLPSRGSACGDASMQWQLLHRMAGEGAPMVVRRSRGPAGQAQAGRLLSCGPRGGRCEQPHRCSRASHGLLQAPAPAPGAHVEGAGLAWTSLTSFERSASLQNAAPPPSRRGSHRRPCSLLPMLPCGAEPGKSQPNSDRGVQSGMPLQTACVSCLNGVQAWVDGGQ